MKKIMVITPHADDVTISVGGAVIKWVEEDHEVTVVRVTNDDADCIGISTREEAVAINKAEAEEAYKVLGVSRTIHMGYVSDTFGGVDFLELREKFIWLIREIKPDRTLCFDLDGREEENMDHRVISYAMAEALWTSSFDLHHPEHFKEGLEPFCVPERLYYARVSDKANIVIDISDVIDRKFKSIQCQKAVMKNIFAQIRMRAEALGEDASVMDKYSIDEMVDKLFRAAAAEAGKKFGLQYAELLRDPGTGLLRDFIKV